MTSQFDFDLIVIGAGSGGVRAGRIAAGYGARVAVIEGGSPARRDLCHSRLCTEKIAGLWSKFCRRGRRCGRIWLADGGAEP